MKTTTQLRLVLAGLILLIYTVDLSAQTDFKDLVGHSVLTYGDEGEWDDGYVWSPTIIKDGDTLRMWYRGSHGTLDNTITGHIGYAWSLDGIEWNKYPENPVLSATLDWEGDIVENPIVIKDGDTLKMWYDSKEQGYAESLDGINWTKHPEPLTLAEGPQSEWDDGFLWISTIFKEDNEYKMWYSGGRPGFPGGNSYPQVGLATSPDGLNWTKYDDPTTQNAPYAYSDPVLKVGEENDWDYLRAYFPKVIKTDSGYTMFYTGIKGPVSSEVKQQAGLAYSNDGINWIKDEHNPIIKDDHSVVDWGRGIMSCAALYYNDRFHYWFCCEFTPPYRLRPQVGYATQLIPCYSESFEFTTQAEIDSFKSDCNNCNMVEGSVTINGDDITNLNGLSNLTSIGNDLQIGIYNEGNPSLVSLSGLENLTSVGNLKISSNTSLINLNGLNNLTSLWGDINITDNSVLINLSGLERLDTIMNLNISNNDALSSLSGLNNLTSIIGFGIYGSHLHIDDNDALINLNGLENLASLHTGIGGWESQITILDNDAMVSLQGIEKMDAETVQGLTITGNSSLSICDSKVICNILNDTIADVIIENNALGCNNQEEVEEDCNNNCLPTGFSPYFQEEIDNFPSKYAGCSEIEGNVSIGSGFITNLDSLYVITTIGGNFSIGGCNNLQGLSGLDNISHIGGNLFIKNNENLSMCDAFGICNYLQNPNGTVEIHDNAPGCNSQEEVKEACGLAVDEIHFFNKLSYYPNPFSNTITIEFELKQSGLITITVFNHLGEQIEVINEKRSSGNQQIIWNTAKVPAGIYFCVLKTNQGIQTNKMIKL